MPCSFILLTDDKKKNQSPVCEFHNVISDTLSIITIVTFIAYTTYIQLTACFKIMDISRINMFLKLARISVLEKRTLGQQLYMSQFS